MSIDDMLNEESSLQKSFPDQPAAQQEQPTGSGFAIPEFLKAKTGSGLVEDYIDHPMNIGKNEGFARMLRGLTGMFNSLDYAIIDVVIGGFKFMKKGDRTA